VDFIQRRTWNSGENTKKAVPDWTKSNEAEMFREKADFGWIKSIQDSPSPSSSLLHVWRNDGFPIDRGVWRKLRNAAQAFLEHQESPSDG